MGSVPGPKTHVITVLLFAIMYFYIIRVTNVLLVPVTAGCAVYICL